MPTTIKPSSYPRFIHAYNEQILYVVSKASLAVKNHSYGRLQKVLLHHLKQCTETRSEMRKREKSIKVLKG